MQIMDNRRIAYKEEHELFRQTVRRFTENTLVPGNREWEKNGFVPREVWREAGKLGLLCSSIDIEYGGAGGDYLCDVILMEEMSRAGVNGPLAGFIVHSFVVAPYFVRFGTESQRREWLPKLASGEAIAALGLTEPDAGSDLRGIKTRARRQDNEYIISGQKTWISNGYNADIVVLATKLEQTESNQITLMLVETNRDGVSRGKPIEKIGLKAQDTCELFFDDVRIPVSNRLGDEGKGMHYLSANLAVERLAQAIRSTAVAESALEWTIQYTMERKAFGKRIADYQNTQFKLAELTAEVRVLRSYIDECILLHLDGRLGQVEAAIAKLRATEIHCKTTDECLQLHGGWGYAWETPIARAFADGRVAKIAAGSVEIMKLLISRSIFRDGHQPDKS